LKGLQSYVNCDIPGICTPFMVLVDYRGFRLIAMSILPIDKQTLVSLSSLVSLPVSVPSAYPYLFKTSDLWIFKRWKDSCERRSEG
jgi:hypothetical protein